MPVLSRLNHRVMLCHFFAYGMYLSQFVFLLTPSSEWASLSRALSHLLMADGVINIFAQLFR